MIVINTICHQVTLVSNLEQFGFSLPALSHVCQTGVAASCGVTRSPGAKADQLMVQGDQVTRHSMCDHRAQNYSLGCYCPKKLPMSIYVNLYLQ